jgi:hypothetical protein
MNLIQAGKMKEFLVSCNIGTIPTDSDTADVAFQILLEVGKDEEKTKELCSILSIEYSEDFEPILEALNHFFVCLGEKLLKFLSIINIERNRHSEMVGEMMTQAILPKLLEAMNSSMDLESFAKTVSEILPKS